MKNPITYSAGIMLATTSLSLAGSSQPLTPPPLSIENTNNGWYYRAAIYLWAQSLDGDIGVRNNIADINVPFSDLVDNLEVGFMGSLEIGKDRWSLLLDLNYADISGDHRTPRSSISLEQKQLITNLVLGYEVYQSNSSTLSLFGGMRSNWLDVNIDFNDLHIDQDKSWVDPIIGLRYNHLFNEDFYLRAAGDIGGFGISSDLTWQAMLGLGWQINPCTGAVIGYRAIYTDYHDDGFTYDVTAHGPVIGIEYKF